jgi:multidrug resistance efflux pump
MQEGIVGSPATRVDRIAVFGRPRLWFPLMALLVLLLSLGVWGFLARAPQGQPIVGVITSPGGTVDIGSSLTGTVTAVFVEVGESVTAGNNLVEIQDDVGRVVRVQATVSGLVLESSTRVGAFVQAGETLLIIEVDRAELLALAFVPVSSVGAIQIGQRALIAPASTPVDTYGHIEGAVASIGDVPMSPARFAQLTARTEGLTEVVDQGVPIVEVRIALAPDAQTPSGLQWTLAPGPPFRLLSGTPFTGQIVLGESSPLSLLFGVGLTPALIPLHR